jgi:hypothetical protein
MLKLLSLFFILGLKEQLSIFSSSLASLRLGRKLKATLSVSELRPASFLVPALKHCQERFFTIAFFFVSNFGLNSK